MDKTSAQKTYSQKGVASILLILLLVLGVGLGVYLIQQKTQLKPKAAGEFDLSSQTLDYQPNYQSSQDPRAQNAPDPSNLLDVGLSLPEENGDSLEFKVLYLYSKDSFLGIPPDPLKIDYYAKKIAMYFEDMSPKFKFISYKIAGPFDLSSYNLPNCDGTNVGPALINEAKKVGITIADYTNALYISSLLCAGQGIPINQAGIKGLESDIGLVTTIHEMSHSLYHPSLTNLPIKNWGLGHSGVFKKNCVSKITDIFSFDFSVCDIELFDRDVGTPMGMMQHRGYIAPHRFFFSAFPSEDIIEVNSNIDFKEGSIYTLSPLNTGRTEVGGRSYPAPHAIKVNKSDGSFIMFSYRKKEGWDKINRYPDLDRDQNMFAGASVHYVWNEDSGSGLIMNLIDGSELPIGNSLAIRQISHDKDHVFLKIVKKSSIPSPTATSSPRSHNKTPKPKPTDIIITL